MFTVMTNAGLSLNQKELNTLMVAVDEDEDGKVWPPRDPGQPSARWGRLGHVPSASLRAAHHCAE